MKLIQRIIVSPLMLLLLLLYYLFHAVERWVSYLRYGGEVITYDKDSKKMIQDVRISANTNNEEMKMKKVKKIIGWAILAA